MKAVVDRIVQYANRYQLTNVETGEVLGTFDFEEVTGTVQQVGTEIDAELFQSIADDLAARVKLSGGELKDTVVTFSDISGTAANVASGDTSATLWGKVKNWFSRLKALAFKDTISNADVASDAAIDKSKIDGLAEAFESDGSTVKKATYADNAKGVAEIIDNTTKIHNSFGGFAAGNSANGSWGGAIGSEAQAKDGGAIGQNSSSDSGGAIGREAYTTIGGAVGQYANSYRGGAVGAAATTNSGGAVGQGAESTTGFAGGFHAKATAGGAVQLGQGTNNNADTLQFREYQIVDANGNIPASRLSANSPVRSVNGQTGAVSLSAADVGAATETQVNSVSMVPYGGQATTLSALASGGVYSISANGFLRIAYQTTAADNFISMKQVSSSGADMWGFLANGQKSYGSGYPFIYMPVAADDHIKVEFGSSVKIIQVQLIKVKTV